MASINQQTLSVQSDEVQQAGISYIIHVPQTGFVNREGYLEHNIITIAKCIT